MSSRIILVPDSVRKICQLTGEMDRQTHQKTPNQTETRFQLFGTDLGSSFEHGGRLWLLFGDSVPVGSQGDASDSVAWTTDTNPEQCIHLNFVSDGGHYRSPRLVDQSGHALNTGAFNVPVSGFTVRGPAGLNRPNVRVLPQADVDSCTLQGTESRIVRTNPGLMRCISGGSLSVPTANLKRRRSARCRTAGGQFMVVQNWHTD